MRVGWIAAAAGLCVSIAAQAALDARRSAPAAIEEGLYLRSGETLRVASPGFEGVLADLYWIRTVQYFGRELERQRATSETIDPGRMALLEPLLEITTELDPRHVAAFRFGAFFLQYADAEKAAQFAERGIRSNPGEWRLHQDLGFIRWRQGRFREAAAAYERGSRLPDAPPWMQVMAATMAARGGDRETARELFRRLCDGSDDPFIRSVCEEGERARRRRGD